MDLGVEELKVIGDRARDGTTTMFYSVYYLHIFKMTKETALPPLKFQSKY